MLALLYIDGYCLLIVRTFASIRLNFSIYFTLRTYFFYLNNIIFSFLYYYLLISIYFVYIFFSLSSEPSLSKISILSPSQSSLNSLPLSYPKPKLSHTTAYLVAVVAVEDLAAAIVEDPTVAAIADRAATDQVADLAPLGFFTWVICWVWF